MHELFYEFKLKDRVKLGNKEQIGTVELGNNELFGRPKIVP